MSDTPDGGNPSHRGLMDRLVHGPVICAEGYVFELERRGYLQTGSFVPEVLTDHPELVEQLYCDLVHAWSDVTHREDITRQGWTPAETCQRLEDAGAEVVGLNCYRRPATMLPLLAVA
jgi:methionine synthase I (cobalamin-dependent)